MAKALLLQLLYRIARQYFDRDLFIRIESLVLNLMDSEASGDDKRRMVRNAIWAEWRDISTIAIDTAIQVVLLKNTQP